MSQLYVLILFFIRVVFSTFLDELCEETPNHLLCLKDIKCEGKDMTLYEDPNFSTANHIMDRLNDLRSKVSNSENEVAFVENRVPSRMRQLRVDTTLVAMARAHLMTCEVGKKSKDVTNINQFGVDVIIVYVLSEGRDRENWADNNNMPIIRPIDELVSIQNYTFAEARKIITSHPTEKEISDLNYYQNTILLLQDEIYMIGCAGGMMEYVSSGPLIKHKFLVCYIGPQFEDNPIDRLWRNIGIKCQDCPSNQCSDIYDGLCSADELPDVESYWSVEDPCKAVSAPFVDCEDFEVVDSNCKCKDNKIPIDRTKDICLSGCKKPPRGIFTRKPGVPRPYPDIYIDEDDEAKTEGGSTAERIRALHEVLYFAIILLIQFGVQFFK